MGQSPSLSHYVIRGGLKGRERLRLLSRVVGAGTAALLDRVAIPEGARCLDVACGGGDVTRLLAKRAGPRGAAVGVDADAEKIQMARDEARSEGALHVEFVAADLRGWDPSEAFDVVYARFILTHLPDPAEAAARFYRWTRSGGRVIVEDIDYRGAFAFPDVEAFRRYCELYCEAVKRRGGDPFIGPRLPSLLKGAGFADVEVSMTQPIGLIGEVKLLHALTLENTADAIVDSSLATRSEDHALIQQLHALAADDETLMAAPRIVQAWGRRAP